MTYELLRIPFILPFRLLYRLKVEGLENLPRKGPLILVANHSSYLDPLAVGVTIPRRIIWMVRRPVYDVWSLKWFFKLCYCIRIDTERSDIKAIRRALGVLSRGGVLGIFPEGNRSLTGRVGEGKPGVALLAKLSQAPVVPVAIKGTFEAYPSKQWFPKIHPVRVRIGKPLTLEGLDNKLKDKIFQEATAQIMGAIEELNKD